MEDYFVIREFITGLGSLVAATMVVSIAFIYFFLKLRSSIEEEESQLLASLSIGFLFIVLLIFLRKEIAISYATTNHNLYLLLTLGFTIQFFLPLYIYSIQRIGGKLLSYWSVLLVVSSLFIVNLSLLFLAPNFSTTTQIALRHLLQTIAIAVILYRIFITSKILKELGAYNLGENNFYMTDFLLFSLSAAIVIVLFSSMYFGISLIKVEVLKLSLFVSNLYLLFKIVKYNTSKERYQDSESKLSLAIQNSTSDSCVEYENGRFDELKERLLKYFEQEKPYLDSKLNINKVSLFLYSNKTYLSRLINEEMRSNFSQFVNHYRIEEAKRLYSADTRLSIQQLCDRSGFGSQATFNMAFKIFTGKTPAEWCKEFKIKARISDDRESND